MDPPTILEVEARLATCCVRLVGRMVQKFKPAAMGCFFAHGQVTRWSSDPFFRGSYSFLPTNSMAGDSWEVVNARHDRHLTAVTQQLSSIQLS